MTTLQIIGGPPATNAKRERRVDPDDRREIGEPEGEVLPQPHAALEVALVPELGKLFGVGPHPANLLVLTGFGGTYRVRRKVRWR